MAVVRPVDSTDEGWFSRSRDTTIKIGYLDRKLGDVCVSRGCTAQAGIDSVRCQACQARHNATQRAAMAKRRARLRRERRCVYCPAGREMVLRRGRRTCDACAIRLGYSSVVRPVDSPDDKRARALRATRTHADGRTRYHGQGKRGQQPKHQLDDQDLRAAALHLERAIKGRAAVAQWQAEQAAGAPDARPREQLRAALEAALSEAHLASRLILDALERNRYVVAPVTAEMAAVDAEIARGKRRRS